jgi:hypothetical protein
MRPIHACVSAVALLGVASVASAVVDVTVDPTPTWLGFMNVSNLPAPAGDGVYQFGGPWGFADLTAQFNGNELTLAPNTIGDPNEYWYQGQGQNPGGPGAPGNKIMAASAYVENSDVLVGQTVRFTVEVLANTFTSAHSTTMFIRDFAPDYSSNVSTTVALNGPGIYNLTLDTINTAGRHVQYGFDTVGVNVWVTDVTPFGNIRIGPASVVIPEPATLGLLALAPLALRRRRQA